MFPELRFLSFLPETKEDPPQSDPGLKKDTKRLKKESNQPETEDRIKESRPPQAKTHQNVDLGPRIPLELYSDDYKAPEPIQETKQKPSGSVSFVWVDQINEWEIPLSVSNHPDASQKGAERESKEKETNEKRKDDT